MWTLFTRALKAGHSATQVSIMNTSANFVLTALLGLVIFAETLPPLWWIGATLLVAGNVIIGRKDEGHDAAENSETGQPSSDAPPPAAYRDDVGDVNDAEEAEEADEAAVAATTVSAAAATISGANEARADAEAATSKARRTSRRLAAQQQQQRA